jgi:hypothetical protein
MKKLMKNVSTVLLLTALSACGGGSDGGDNVKIPDKKNINPIISFSQGEIQIIENSTSLINLESSDIDGDTLTIDITSLDPSILKATYANGVVSLTSMNVTEDQIVQVTATVNDGKGGSANTFMSVTITDIPNSIPEVTMSPKTFEMEKNSEATIALEVYDADSDTLDVSVESSNTDLLTVELQNDGLILLKTLDVEITENIDVTVTATVTDGKDTTINTSVITIVYVDPNNLAPKISLLNSDENDMVVIFGDTRNEIAVSTTDSDSSDVTWSIKSLEGIDSPDAVLDLVNSYGVEGNTIVMDMKSAPTFRLISFLIVLSVTDGTTTVDKEFTLSLTARPNGSPLFDIEGLISGFVPVPIGTTKSFKYSIVDDAPNNVVMGEVSIWYGTEENYTIAVEHSTQTITVTNNNAPLEDTYGILIAYEDYNYSGSAIFQFTSSVEFGTLQNETLDYIQVMYNKIEALKEYQYIGSFYSEVLENLNYVSEREALDFKRKMLTTDSGDFAVTRSWLATLEALVVFGVWQDPTIIESYKSGIDTQFEYARQNYASVTYSTINDMSILTESLLPVFAFENTLNEYDTTNNYFSRFTGNSIYGDVVNDKFVFNEKYSFLRAILAKTEESAKEAYSH